MAVWPAALPLVLDMLRNILKAAGLMTTARQHKCKARSTLAAVLCAYTLHQESALASGRVRHLMWARMPNGGVVELGVLLPHALRPRDRQHVRLERSPQHLRLPLPRERGDKGAHGRIKALQFRHNSRALHLQCASEFTAPRERGLLAHERTAFASRMWLQCEAEGIIGSGRGRRGHTLNRSAALTPWLFARPICRPCAHVARSMAS